MSGQWLLAAATLLPALPARAQILGPSWLEPALSYYNSFEGGLDRPEVCIEGLTTDPAARVGPVDDSVQPIVGLEDGYLGKGLEVRAWQAPLVLKGPALSPHRPLTLSFWWALPYDLAIDGGFQLFSITGGGLVSHFSRGKGEWCALQRPAGVFQVYYFEGIQNVNGIYDFDLPSHLDLRKGVWHHEAVVFRGGRQIQVFTDGAMVTQVDLSGREFTEADNLTTLSVGGPLWLDELAILSRAIDQDQVREYYLGLSRIREYRAPSEH